MVISPHGAGALPEMIVILYSTKRIERLKTERFGQSLNDSCLFFRRLHALICCYMSVQPSGEDSIFLSHHRI